MEPLTVAQVLSVVIPMALISVYVSRVMNATIQLHAQVGCYLLNWPSDFFLSKQTFILRGKILIQKKICLIPSCSEIASSVLMTATLASSERRAYTLYAYVYGTTHAHVILLTNDHWRCSTCTHINCKIHHTQWSIAALLINSELANNIMCPQQVMYGFLVMLLLRKLNCFYSTIPRVQHAHIHIRDVVTV